MRCGADVRPPAVSPFFPLWLVCALWRNGDLPIYSLELHPGPAGGPGPGLTPRWVRAGSSGGYPGHSLAPGSGCLPMTQGQAGDAGARQGEGDGKGGAS